MVDSSVLITAERAGQPNSQLLAHLQSGYPGAALGISAITVAELMHGVYRAQMTAVRERRLHFIDRICHDIPVYPVTVEVAKVIGRIHGEQAALGNVLPFQDLAIGATALLLGFDVLTSNVRHFQRIPGLGVLQP